MADTEEEIVDSVVPPSWVDTRALGTTFTSEPDAQAAAPTSGTVDSLVTKPEDVAALQARLVEIKKRQMVSSGGVADETVRRLRSDRAQMDEAYKATALPPDALQPWDVKAKQNEYRTDPVEAFGSIGSVFAMLASSFAGLPMEYALNAGAEAIKAVHAGDEKAYDREQKAWKENTDLALKRHEIQRQSYNDAILKMNTNLNAGRSELELSARKFGDQQALALLEMGMDKELNALIDGRNKSALELQSTADKVWLEHEKVTDLKSDPRYLSGSPELKAKAVQEWQEKWKPAGARQLAYNSRKEITDQYKKENPNYTADDLIALEGKIAQAEAAGVGAGVSGESSQVRKSRAIKEIQDKNPGMSIAEAEKQFNMTVSTPSGNRMDDQAQMINQLSNGMNGIDKAMTVLDKYVGAAGAAGYATRLGERVGNIFGTNNTDRSQFAHEIEYLQAIAPRLLQGTGGRPLSAEAGKINRLIAGLNMGDTTANTKRALEEVRELWGKMQQDVLARRSGSPNLPAATGGGAPASSGATAPWNRDPIIKPAPGPRSSLDGPVMSDADPEGIVPGADYAAMEDRNRGGFPKIEVGGGGAGRFGGGGSGPMIKAPDYSKPPSVANDRTVTEGRVRAGSYENAKRDQTIRQNTDEATRVGDFSYWKNVAEKEGLSTFTGRTNANAAARRYSEGGKTTVLINTDGRRVVYHDGSKMVRERRDSVLDAE